MVEEYFPVPRTWLLCFAQTWEVKSLASFRLFVLRTV